MVIIIKLEMYFKMSICFDFIRIELEIDKCLRYFVYFGVYGLMVIDNLVIYVKLLLSWFYINDF